MAMPTEGDKQRDKWADCVAKIKDSARMLAFRRTVMGENDIHAAHDRARESAIFLGEEVERMQKLLDPTGKNRV